MAYEALPPKVRKLLLLQSVAIDAILERQRRQLTAIIKSIKTEKDLAVRSSQISSTFRQSQAAMEDVMYKYSSEAWTVSITEDVDFLRKVGLSRVAPEVFGKYLDGAQKLINTSMSEYLTSVNDVYGSTLRFRLTTIRKGTEETVSNILRMGISEGKSANQLAKDIQNYIKQDKRKPWESPASIAKAVGENPNVPAGSVEYNALRIARTELINNYRWKRIEASIGQPWVVGYQWALSPSHPIKDICDDWATRDEGLGPGVYSDAATVFSFGHPHCFCNVLVITLFHSAFQKYFDEAFQDRFSPEQEAFFELGLSD